MARRKRGIKRNGMLEIEKSARKYGMEKGRQALEDALQRWVGGIEWPRKLLSAAGEVTFILKQWISLKVSTTLGEIALRVPYYWKSGAKGLNPVKEALGLSGHNSPALERACASLAAELPFHSCAAEMVNVGGQEISATTIHQHALDLGQAALGEQLRARLPKGFGEPELMTIEIDGGRVNTKEKWREPRLARIEVVSETKKTAVFALSRITSAEAFWSLLTPLLEALKINVCKQVAFLSDGATWILDVAKAKFPQALCVLDFFHAAEHIHAAAKEVFQTVSHAQSWARKWCKQLKRGRVDHVLQGMKRSRSRLLRRGCDVAGLDKLLAYLGSRRDQLLYATARRRGFRIGSGRIEALIKQGVNLRLKRNGARWRVPNAESILALRLAKITGHFGEVFGRYISEKCLSVPSQFFTLMQANPLPDSLSPDRPHTLAA